MTACRNEIRFLLNDRAVRLSEVGASDTLLDHVRLEQRLRGTKEGCAEGDCGACTVLVGRVVEGVLVYETVNACIRLLASVDLCHVVTVEALGGADGSLHPVQQAMVDHHASQCGFCTPGIVMSLYALWMEDLDPTVAEIETALQGNLCRCTGYRPIIAAAQAAERARDWLGSERGRILERLRAMDDGLRVEASRGGNRAILPNSVDDLAAVLGAMPEATVVAGATDVGLWVTKHMRDISPAVFIGHLDALRQVSVGDEGVTLGAGASYSGCEAVLAEQFPHLAEYWLRIGGWQVRNMGTVGGNIANGSPIGDTPPVLIALDARLNLRRGAVRRTIPLEEFFIAYGRQDRTPGEFVESVTIPFAAEGSLHAAYKISKRRDEDISSVCGAFNLMVTEGVIRTARIAYGGMAGTPKRALHVEAALIGKPWTEERILAAQQAFQDDFSPLTDWRASAEYRAVAARNLLRRFYLEHSGGAERVSLSRAASA